MKRYRRFNIIVTVVIFVGFTLLGIFVFQLSYCRRFEALIDLYGSFKYYFMNLFGIETSDFPSVILPSKVLDNTTNLPSDFGGFTQQTKDYFYWFFNGENFKLWGVITAERFTEFLKVITILLPCFILVIVVIKRIYGAVNNNYNADTKPLKAYKWLTKRTVLPLKKLILDYIDFVRQNLWIWITWLVIWIFHLNLATIIIEFFAYYFFFAITFQLGTIYTQFVKLAVDLQVLFTHVPLWVLLIIGIVLLDRWRRKTAKNRLRHFEARNCGFINELPIVSMSCGSMGKKKTTLITDMALSQEVMFRQKALEILQNADMKFPYFPWICFEKQIQTAMGYGQIYNLASAKIFVHKKRERYLKNTDNTEQIYGYDIARYGGEFCDELSVKSLFDVLETYALAYFVYVIESSLIVSNFSIRTDNFVISEGNFPMWVTDFFPENLTGGRHSHILDFDVLRLGKKVLENNPKAGSFEFGVVAITEVGKERGNNLELKEVKKKNDETNQKNDLFNSWLKMCRHSATIDNFPFIKVFTDEQRPESWGADARDLCDIIHIVSSGEQRLALPLYAIEEMVTEWLVNRVIALYYDFRYSRGDNTLLIYLLKSLAAKLWQRNLRIYNKYGYSVLQIEKERGTMDGKPDKRKYYLMNRKIYAKRFSTDCFSDYFNEMARNAKTGINDYIEYATEKASVSELKEQHSYFINALYKSNEEDTAMN